MANIKVPKHRKKVTASFSIELREIEDFKEYCRVNKLVYSHELAKLVTKFNDENKNH